MALVYGFMVCKVQLSECRGASETQSKQRLSTIGERYKRILSTIYTCGEYEKVVQGVFKNYVNMQFKDLKLENETRESGLVH